MIKLDVTFLDSTGNRATTHFVGPDFAFTFEDDMALRVAGRNEAGDFIESVFARGEWRNVTRTVPASRAG